MKHYLAALAVISVVSATGAHAASATLDTLIPTGSLSEGDVTFSDFFFEDQADTGSFPDDTEVSSDMITVETGSASADTVFLMFTVAPEISIADADGFFEFFVDFSVNVTGSRTLESVLLHMGDLSATGDAFSEVEFDLGLIGGPQLALFEDPLGTGSSTSDSDALASLTALDLFGLVGGRTKDIGDTAGLSTFKLTFTLDGSAPPPPPPAVPLPAGLPLILAGLGSLALLKRVRG